MARGIYIRLPEREREALIKLADREWRQPREQATKLLSEALREASTSSTDRRSDQAAVGRK